MKTLPEDFIQYTQELMGDELFQQLKQGITEGEAPTSIRLNPFKCKEGEDAAGEPIPWCPSTGRYLSTRPNFTFDPWLHAGKYYVQEASSMFVDLVIRQLVHDTRDDARPLCGSWRKVYSRACCPARRKSALQQRTDAHPLTDSCGEHSEVRSSRHDCHQQLSTRLQEVEASVRRHPHRCALLGRRHVPQGRWSHQRMEPAECGQLLASAARNRERHLELPETGRHPHLLHLHLQCPRRRGEHRMDLRGTGC